MTKAKKRNSRNINFLDDIGNIKNKSVLIHFISRNFNVPSNQLPIDIINQNALLTENQIYYDEKLNETDGDSPDAKTLLVQIIGNPPSREDELFVCLTKSQNGEWEGGRAGSIDVLLEDITQRQASLKSPESRQPKTSSDSQPSSNTETQEPSVEEENEIESEIISEQPEENAVPDNPSPEIVSYMDEMALELDNTYEEEEESEEKAEEVPENHDADSDTTKETRKTGNAKENSTHLENKTVSKKNTPHAVQNPVSKASESEITILANVENIVDYQVIVMSKSWTTIAGDYNALRYYLESICCYAYTHQDKQDIITNNMDDYVVNTGILDIFGQEVLICFHVLEDKVNITIDEFSPAESKAVLLQKGFTEKDIRKKLRPVTVWENDDISRIKSAKYEDFDLADRSKLKMLLTSKQELLLSHGIDTSPYTLAKSIEESIRLALRINKRDENYIRPGYDNMTGNIHFMMPLRIKANIDSMADLILEVEYDEGLYRISNILTHEEAYLKNKVVSPYCASLA